jgi:hypothetical protein
VVHHARQAAGLIAVLALAAGLGACGEEQRAAATTPTKALISGGVVRKDLGEDVRLANCAHWKRGDVQARYGTIEEIRGFAGSAVGNDNGVGNVLTADAAYALFQGWCGRRYARSFKLYKLYVRAAAFTP